MVKTNQKPKNTPEKMVLMSDLDFAAKFGSKVLHVILLTSMILIVCSNNNKVGRMKHLAVLSYVSVAKKPHQYVLRAVLLNSSSMYFTWKSSLNKYFGMAVVDGVVCK